MIRRGRPRDVGPRQAAWLAIAMTIGLTTIFILPASKRAHAANGAFAVDDADVGEVGECKVESWASFASNRDFIGVVSPACVVNLGRPVEINTQFSGFNAGNVWGESLTLKGKTNIVKSGQGVIGVGVSGAATFDLTNGDVTALTVNVPLTVQITDTFKINVNGGWIYDPTARQHFGLVGAGFEWNFVKPLTLIGEVYAVLGEGQHNPRAQLGLRYTPVEDIDIDLIYGRNIAGEDANWITVGLNVRFNAFGKK